jgi:hypothetical protein
VLDLALQFLRLAHLLSPWSYSLRSLRKAYFSYQHDLMMSPLAHLFKHRDIIIEFDNFIGKRKKFYWKKKEILLEKERQDYRHK